MTDAKISIGGVKKGRNEGLKAITANRITDGVPVWLAADGRWAESLADAAIYEGARALSALEYAAAQEAMVVGPYLMEIDRAAGSVQPAGRTILREAIRNAGPTVPSDYSVPVE
ncbi:DUF2849 domain-containing protein [Parvularcula sp. IMCC14364]|uniref:DUF2849 domain-containing protein n=1 Tax=Parvularcula sp. IMCC14364 TaxID=3067902 RepID=UPI002742024C|nr:DUF2849 domain-containing protein [Parvularcula sp. IMCC14364]